MQQTEASSLILQVGGSTVEAKLDVSNLSILLLFLLYPPLKSCVADLGSSAASFKELRETAITSVCETLLLPKFQPLVDTFSSYSHVLSEVNGIVLSCMVIMHLYFLGGLF